jgi:hypothetical protein
MNHISPQPTKMKGAETGEAICTYFKAMMWTSHLEWAMGEAGKICKIIGFKV